MASTKVTEPRRIPALKVHQWLQEWDSLEFDEEAYRRRPDENFYIFSISAADLKSLTGIRHRTLLNREKGQADTGIQRAHDSKRSDEIARYARSGFPWSALSRSRRQSGQFDDLKKPGWLPTSIIVNIHDKEANGSGPSDVNVHEDDLVLLIDNDDGIAQVQLPRSFTGSNWEPKGDFPIDVIDGQHRLWAFDTGLDAEEYQLPVVAFIGLDWSWQAYLFYTINIKPERINASLAFDLYPLLRTEDWLQRIEGPAVYRETRAQELTQTLWAHPDSAWHRHINMLGRRGGRQMVRQAAWIRSLMATYVRYGGRGGIGGLFGERPGRPVLTWSRIQQAAFLILMGQLMRDAVSETNLEWSKALREETRFQGKGSDPAFYGSHSLLNTDQGIRGLLHVTNDFCYYYADYFEIEAWTPLESQGVDDQDSVSKELEALLQKQIASFLHLLCVELSGFDWRTSSAPGLTEEDQLLKSAYRGSGGYRLLRGQLRGYVKWCVKDIRRRPLPRSVQLSRLRTSDRHRQPSSTLAHSAF